MSKVDLDHCTAWARALAASGCYDGADAATLLPRIALGLAAGTDPATACSNITISKGKAAFSASFQAALLVRRGVVRYDIVTASEEVVELAWFREGKQVGTSKFTIAEAKRAGLTSKAVWASYPEDLLFARALTRGVRRFAPETLAGMPSYTAEELGGDDLADAGRSHPPRAIDLAGPGSAAPRATVAQLDDLRRLKDELAIPDESWRQIVHRRGGITTARDFTPEEADELIAKLRHRVSTQQLQDALPSGPRGEGGASANAEVFHVAPV